MSTTPKRPQLYVGGAWVDASGDESVPVVNPATEEVIADVPQGTVADVDAAIRAARTANDSGPWPRMSPRERSDVLVRFVETVAARRDDLVDLIVAEAGLAFSGENTDDGAGDVADADRLADRVFSAK